MYLLLFGGNISNTKIQFRLLEKPMLSGQLLFFFIHRITWPGEGLFSAPGTEDSFSHHGPFNVRVLMHKTHPDHENGDLCWENQEEPLLVSGLVPLTGRNMEKETFIIASCVNLTP